MESPVKNKKNLSFLSIPRVIWADDAPNINLLVTSLEFQIW